MNLEPFKFWCQKVLPLSYDDSLSYYELLCKVVYTLNTSIGELNNISDAILKLENYVNNYFNNLDISKEINDKLDEMANSGELASIISGKILFKCVDDMVNSELVISSAITMSYYNDNNGGGANYVISDRYAENDIYLELKNGKYAILQHTNTVNVLQLGIKNDGETDNTELINKYTQLVNLYFPSGVYKCFNPVFKKSIFGESGNEIGSSSLKYHSTLKLLKESDNGYTFDSDERNDITIRNICFDCGGFFSKYGLHIKSDCRFNISNVTVKNFDQVTVKEQIGIMLETNMLENISRHVYMSNIDVLIYNEYSTGIKTDNSSNDNSYTNMRIMGVNKCITNSGTILRISNVHGWGGMLNNPPAPNNWNKSAFLYSSGLTILDNIYCDTLGILCYNTGSTNNISIFNNTLMYCGGTLAREIYTKNNKYEQTLTRGCNSTHRRCVINNLFLYPNECYTGIGKYLAYENIIGDKKIIIKNIMVNSSNLTDIISQLADTINNGICETMNSTSFPYTQAKLTNGTGYKICSLYSYNRNYMEMLINIGETTLSLKINIYSAVNATYKVVTGSGTAFDLYYKLNTLNNGFIVDIYVIGLQNVTINDVNIGGIINCGIGGLIDYSVITPRLESSDLSVNSTMGLTKINKE